LPGLFGGDAGQCLNPPRCFSTRMMFRENGDGELYPTLRNDLQPPSFCGFPGSKCGNGDDSIGGTIGRGAWRFAKGIWTQLCQRITMNDDGMNNGRIQMLVDGKVKIDLRDLYVADYDISINGFIVHSFFGGNDPIYASPKNQSSYFRHFYMRPVDYFPET
jgi:hypothetical protein